MLISDVANQMNGQLVGDDVEFFSVSTDTRTIKPGDLFVALKGPNFDGHEYLGVAEKDGAVAALISENVETALSTVLVKDTWRGLGQLAKAWRSQFQMPTVAITGSCGKTTLKEMVAAILSLRGKTHFTQGNFNNDIGVPITLLKLSAEHQYAVIELGANHLGEIAYTSGLTQPDVAVVTNAGEAHIEGFGSKENVAKAKGEIFEGLSSTGIAVLNGDDAFYDYWQSLVTDKKQVSFSLENTETDFYGSTFVVGENGKCQFILNATSTATSETIEINLPLLGKSNALNAIAAAAVANSMGATLVEIKAGLESVKAIRGRLFPMDVGPLKIIDDSYNANPVSIHAAIDLLAGVPGESCLVLGDMAELGVHSPSMHREVGAYAAKQGIESLVVQGKHTSDYLVGFTAHKETGQRGVAFDTIEEVASFIVGEVSEALILVKGSRSAAMERVVDLLEQAANNDNNVEGQG